MAESQRIDMDEIETKEWLDSLEAVIEREGPERAQFLLEKLIDKTRRTGGFIPFSANTAYVNTIPAALEEHCPGNLEYEERLRSWMRWNAMAMVVRQTVVRAISAAIFQAFSHWPTCWGLALIIFGRARTTPRATIFFSSRATHHLESMPVHSLKAGLTRIR